MMNDSDKPADAVPPDRRRIPFPIPQRNLEANRDAEIKAEIVKHAIEPNDVISLSHAGYSLFHMITEATLTTEQVAQIAKGLQDQMAMTMDLIKTMPMPESADLDPKAGDVYTPYLLTFGLNLIAQAICETSPKTNVLQRFALAAEFVRTWAVFGQMAHIIQIPGVKAGDAQHLAACQAVIEPPPLPEIAKLAQQVRAHKELIPKPEKEIDIPVAEGDGATEVTRPKFKFKE